MLFLSLLWLLSGLLIGALGWIARCYPAAWQRSGWLRMPVLGALIACCAGWLGTLLLGNLLSTALVLWVTVLSMFALSRVADAIHRLCMRLLAKTGVKML